MHSIKHVLILTYFFIIFITYMFYSSFSGKTRQSMFCNKAEQSILFILRSTIKHIQEFVDSFQSTLAIFDSLNNSLTCTSRLVHLSYLTKHQTYSTILILQLDNYLLPVEKEFHHSCESTNSNKNFTTRHASTVLDNHPYSELPKKPRTQALYWITTLHSATV